MVLQIKFPNSTTVISLESRNPTVLPVCAPGEGCNGNYLVVPLFFDEHKDIDSEAGSEHNYQVEQSLSGQDYAKLSNLPTHQFVFHA